MRRNCLKHEIEGSLNSIANKLNKEVSDEFLPNCDLKWVTPRNQKAVLENGKAVVCVSFDKRGHDINFYNVAYSFIQLGLLPNTKAFLKAYTRKAIDLLMTKLVLKYIRRSVLRIFNENFVKVETNCKDVYLRLEESENKGLFRSLLLRELKFFGEAVFDKSPSDEISSEAERLLEWFYKLISREKGAETNLAFREKHIKVGVVLVADSEVYDEYGVEAYLRRAYRYASDGYPCVYFISRGARKSRIAHEICRKLVSLEHFGQLNKKTEFVCYEDGHEYVVTCICLSTNYHVMIFDAWNRLEKCKVDKEHIKVTVHIVDIDKIVVDVFSLSVEIGLENLSSMEIVDARKYFQENDILVLNLIKLDRATEYVELSNVGTETDPKRLVDAALTEERVNCRVQKVVHSRDGYDIGLIVANEEKGIWGFVHRKMATFSRFVPLSEKYNVGQEISVNLVGFDPDRKNYKCKVAGLEDPWSRIPSENIREGEVVDATVRSVGTNSLTCEIVEGVEGHVPVTQISWATEKENQNKIREFYPGQKISVKIIMIDEEWRHLKLSIKRIQGNPAESYFLAKNGSIVEGRVVQILPNRGAVLSFRHEEDLIGGFLPINEVSWLYCASIESKLESEQKIKVRVIGFSDKHENIIVSRKRCSRNDFELLAKDLKPGEIVEGAVVSYHGDRLLEVKILHKDYEGIGFIHFSQITSAFFVTGDSWDKFLKPGERYKFEVQRVVERGQVFCLSRRILFKKHVDEVEYGKTYEVHATSIDKDTYIYSDFLEGKLLVESTHVPCLGGKIRVIASRIRESDGWIEAQITDK